MLINNLTIRSLPADIVMDDPSPQIDKRNNDRDNATTNICCGLRGHLKIRGVSDRCWEKAPQKKELKNYYVSDKAEFSRKRLPGQSSRYPAKNTTIPSRFHQRSTTKRVRVREIRLRFRVPKVKCQRRRRHRALRKVDDGEECPRKKKYPSS